MGHLASGFYSKSQSETRTGVGREILASATYACPTSFQEREWLFTVATWSFWLTVWALRHMPRLT
jgi:hypothetical protein